MIKATRALIAAALAAASTGAIPAWAQSPYGQLADMPFLHGYIAKDKALVGRFHRGLLEAGVWMPPSQYEAAFVSMAHGEAEVELMLEATRKTLAAAR